MSTFDRTAQKLGRIARRHPPKADQVGAIAAVLVSAMTDDERQRFVAMASAMEAEAGAA